VRDCVKNYLIVKVELKKTDELSKVIMFLSVNVCQRF